MSNRAPARRADHRPQNPTATRRSVSTAMYAGLALTVFAVIVPYIDRATSNTLAEHIRAGYPTYTQARINTAATTYLVYLSVVGALGVVGWLWTVHAVNSGKRWARTAATAMFVVGTSVALADLLMKDTSGDTGLSPLLGWVGVLPCLPGLIAVMLLWRGP
jgi:hypothetical protein